MGVFDGQEWALSKGHPPQRERQAGETYGYSSPQRYPSYHCLGVTQHRTLHCSGSTPLLPPLPQDKKSQGGFLLLDCAQHSILQFSTWDFYVELTVGRDPALQRDHRKTRNPLLSPYHLFYPFGPSPHRRVRRLAVKLCRSRRVAVKSWPGRIGTSGARKVTASSRGTSWYCGGSSGCSSTPPTGRACSLGSSSGLGPQPPGPSPAGSSV